MRLFHLKYFLLTLLLLVGGGLAADAHFPTEGNEPSGAFERLQSEVAKELSAPDLHEASSSKKEKGDEEGDLELLFLEEEDDDKVKRPFKFAPVRYTWANSGKKEKGVVQLLIRPHPPRAFSQRWHLLLQVFRN